MNRTVINKRTELDYDAWYGENEGAETEGTVQRQKHGRKVHGSGRSALRRAHFFYLRPWTQ